METMGAIKEGRTVWALAKTGVSSDIGAGTGQLDRVEAYLLLYTSFDGSCATTGKFTDVRVVCNNTLSMAQGEKSGKSITVRHNAMFDASKVRADLGVGAVWEGHQARLRSLASAKVTPEQQVSFLLSVYHDITSKSIEASKPKVERTMKRLAGILAHSPGAQLATAQGTLYGLLNAVTYDVDHSPRTRSNDTRLASAWFGAGDALKTKALETATEMLETV
jgi:phage/plasmid-like protein (TIGR03299 family)